MSDGREQEQVDDLVTQSLSMVYEDNDVVVYTAPTEEELKNILLNLLRTKGRMTVKDFHKHLSGLASEDKIRYALNDLLRRELVTMDKQGFFYLTEPIEGSSGVAEEYIIDQDYNTDAYAETSDANEDLPESGQDVQDYY